MNPKSALVTGASRGIGEATAKALTAAGYRVTSVSRTIDPGETADTLAISADLRDPAEVERVFDRHVEKWGQLDLLVACAGVAQIAPVTTGDPEAWSAMWEINVMALALCVRASCSRFPETGGHIINIGSLSGHRVPPVGGFYAATKHAVRAITEAARVELRSAGNPTKVTHISPGFVDTQLVDDYLAPQGKSRVDLGMELLPPEEVARAVMHAVNAPEGTEINDILLRSRDQVS